MAFIARVKVVTSGWTGGPGFSQFYFKNTAETIPDTTEVNVMLARVRASLASLATVEPAGWTAVPDVAVDVLETSSGTLSTIVNGATSSDITGSAGSAFGPAPAGICLNYGTSTIVNGRVVRGRLFCSPLADTNDTTGTPTATVLAAVVAMGTGLTGGGTGGVQHVVWHRPIAGVGGQACPVLTYTVRDRYAMLRSRRS